MESAQPTVEAFIEALERLDIDGAMELADEGIVYQNVPFPPDRGIRATRRTLEWMARFGTGFQARMLNIASHGDVVLTERIDVLEAGRFRAQFWVCGTFQVRDGRIVLWRDRFDFLDLGIASLRGLAGIAFPGLNRA
jgi:limonene-1,2-epoxide hydrolase